MIHVHTVVRLFLHREPIHTTVGKFHDFFFGAYDYEKSVYFLADLLFHICK